MAKRRGRTKARIQVCNWLPESLKDWLEKEKEKRNAEGGGTAEIISSRKFIGNHGVRQKVYTLIWRPDRHKKIRG